MDNFFHPWIESTDDDNESQSRDGEEKVSNDQRCDDENGGSNESDEEEHEEEEPTDPFVKCKLCSYRFCNKTDLERHLIDIHIDPKRRTLDEMRKYRQDTVKSNHLRLRVLRVLGREVSEFLSEFSLNNVKWSPPMEKLPSRFKSLECELCGTKFPTKSDKLAHLCCHFQDVSFRKKTIIEKDDGNLCEINLMVLKEAMKREVKDSIHLHIYSEYSGSNFIPSNWRHEEIPAPSEN